VKQAVPWSQAADDGGRGLLESNQGHEYEFWCPSGAAKVGKMVKEERRSIRGDP
jgi:hypothetical protein